LGDGWIHAVNNMVCGGLLLAMAWCVGAQSNSAEVLLFAYFRDNGKDDGNLATSSARVHFAVLWKEAP
jgi:hypothetical protein